MVKEQAIQPDRPFFARNTTPSTVLPYNLRFFIIVAGHWVLNAICPSQRVQAFESKGNRWLACMMLK
jgi:hypothetical protein